jgi:DNA invertase Pin-like site-specific DNA recombinase
MKTAVGYLRCSTDIQSDTSIPDQQREIEAWAAKQGIQVIEWFKDEGKSGITHQQRPDFMRLIRRVEHRPDFQYILIYDRSRWGRPQDSAMNEYWEMHCKLRGVTLVSLDDPDLTLQPSDLSTRVKKMLKDEEASEYSKKLSRATLRGCISNAARGFSSGGFPPYGYKRVAVHKITGQRRELKRYFDVREGKWKGERNIQKEESVVWDLGDETAVAAVKRIFELKAKGIGYHRIAKMLNDEQVPPPDQNPRRLGPPAWGASTIRSIITNRTYLGERIYNRIPNSPFKKTERGTRPVNNREEWVVVKNAHPAIVSYELFEAANKSLTPTQKPRNQYLAESPYLLTGLIVCSHCRYPFTGAKWKSGAVKVPHYVDYGYITKGRKVCTFYGIKKEHIEQSVLKAIKNAFIEGNVASLLQSLLLKKIQGHSSKSISSEETLAQTLQECQTKIDNLLKAIEAGVQMETIVPRLRELEREKARLTHELERLRTLKVTQNTDVEEVSSQVSKTILEFETSFDSLPTLQKKHIIRKFVHRIIVDRDEGRVRAYIRKIPKLEHPVVDALYASESFNALRAPNRIRTGVPSLKSSCPRPLDDGGREFEN